MQFVKCGDAKKLTGEQRVIASQTMLNEKYPVALGIAFAILKIFLVIAVVLLQVLAFIYKSQYYFIGVGFWVSPFVLLAEILVLVLVKKRNVKLFRLSNAVRMLANVIEIGIVAVNSTAIRRTTCSQCNERDFLWINWAQLACGIVIKVTSLIFAIIVTVRLNKEYKALATSLREQEANDKLMGNNSA